MLFEFITDRMPGNLINNASDRMRKKYGDDTYTDLAITGFGRPLSKYHREFWKAVAKEVKKR